MSILTVQNGLDKLPDQVLSESLTSFLEPLTGLLPDKRLQAVARLSVKGIVAAQSPLITKMAQMVDRQQASTRAASARIYRFINNKRVTSRRLFKGLYHLARRTVERENPPYVVVAIDPVNFEKPYTHKLEGVSTVHKATPPNPKGQARLAKGYPAITACSVNTKVPAISYANWFSYKLDFISQNRELARAFRYSRAVFAGRHLRFVADAGFDDQKIFEWFSKWKASEFVIRLCHLERVIEVYNSRLKRWESEKLGDLVGSVPIQAEWQVKFNHAGEQRVAKIGVGWFTIRLGPKQPRLWVLVAEELEGTEQGRRLVLGTNVALENIEVARQVYEDWRMRSRIEHGYRFEQEAGLDVEGMQVQTLERMRCVYALVLAAAQFVFYLLDSWPPRAVLWIRELGGKLGLKGDRDGPYIFLQGLVTVYRTLLTLSFLRVNPFPKTDFEPIPRCV